MPPTIVVVIREDPKKTAKPVEGLRIALGLSTGENPLSIILLKQSPALLVEDEEDIQDVEVLEKYLPSFKQLHIPFITEVGALTAFDIDPEFNVRETSKEEIASLVSNADRALVF